MARRRTQTPQSRATPRSHTRPPGVYLVSITDSGPQLVAAFKGATAASRPFAGDGGKVQAMVFGPVDAAGACARGLLDIGQRILAVHHNLPQATNSIQPNANQPCNLHRQAPSPSAPSTSRLAPSPPPPRPPSPPPPTLPTARSPRSALRSPPPRPMRMAAGGRRCWSGPTTRSLTRAPAARSGGLATRGLQASNPRCSSTCPPPRAPRRRRRRPPPRTSTSRARLPAARRRRVAAAC